MERYVDKKTGLVVTVADGASLPSYAYEKASGPERRPAAKRKPAAKKAAGKE